jgi:hypothetical protein
MKVSSLAKYALAITTGAGLLAGCSSNGGSSLAPTGSGMSRLGHIGQVVTVDGHMQTAEHPNLSGVRFVGPDVVKKKKVTDQNISNFGAADVSVFDCPHKKCAQIQTVSGIQSAQGECANVLFGSGKKTFWVTSSVSGASPIYEYKVGKTDKQVAGATLQGASGDTIVGCAMSTTGDLAATSINNGDVDIFKGAKGTPTVSKSPCIEAFFPGYDTKGNLYVDGFTSAGFCFAELAKGSSSWTTLSGASVSFPGGVQWDGKYITVNDQEAHTINGYTCSSGSCTLKQTVSLSGASDCDQTWIAKKYVICPDAGNNDAAEYPYPAGGSATHQLTGSFSTPLAASAAE